MSETETEQPEVVTPPEPDESSPDEHEAGEAQEADEAEAPEPIEGDEETAPIEGEPEASGAPRDEKEAQKQRDRLDNEDQRHRDRISAIMGDDATSLIMCPMCQHVTHGFLFPPNLMPLPHENVALIRGLLGMPDLTTYKDAQTTAACPSCDGLGRILSGSKVPGFEVIDCGKCAGKGWVGQLEMPQRNGETAPVTGPTTYTPEALTAMEEDPTIRSLRERGFMVVPPLNTQPAA